MIFIQLTDEQVAMLENSVSAGGCASGERQRPDRRTTKESGRDCGRHADKRGDLIQTVLADLRALQVAIRTAGQREVENRVVAIIDGIENTLAED